MDGSSIGAGFAVGLITIVFLFALYLLPTFIAFGRNCPNRVGIMILNILLGWTLVGWCAALIWSVLRIEDPE